VEECVFCKIIKGEIPCHKVWEDEKHLAFLSIFPNTKGFTVVVPKKHYSSYIFDAENEVIKELIIACKKVGKIIDNYFEDVYRTGLIFEGFGVDHLHGKLIPMHNTSKLEEWKKIESPASNIYFEKYPGYLSSQEPKEMTDNNELAELAKKIKESYE